MQPVLLYITVTNRHEALSIANALLAEQLIACANITENVTSVYRWAGEIQQDKEVVIMAKTLDTLTEKAIERTKALHSYECPCILVVPISGGFAPYLEWAAAQVKG